MLEFFSVAENQPVTELLRAWKDGDRAALDQVAPLVYSELQRLATTYLRREPNSHTLQPTALVHEAWMRVASDAMPDFTSRAHFLGIAARLMRQILVDRARARHAAKRDGGIRVELDDAAGFSGPRAALLVSLDDALTALEAQDAEKAKILELKFFGGLTAEESAEALGISANRVKHQTRLALAWMKRALDGSGASTIPEDSAGHLPETPPQSA